MNASHPTPLSLQEVHALQREAADIRFAAYRSAVLALGRGIRYLATPLTRRLAAALASWRIAEELGAMSDRDLADIGITRSDLSPKRLVEIGNDPTLARNQPRGARPGRAANVNEHFRAAA
jgi:hypothetical protein